MVESNAKMNRYVVTVQQGQMAAVKDAFNQNAGLGEIMYATDRLLKVSSNRSLEEIEQALSGKASVAPETFGTVADASPVASVIGPLGRVAPI